MDQALVDRLLTRRVEGCNPYRPVHVELRQVGKVSFQKEPTTTTNYANIVVVFRGSGEGGRRDEGGGNRSRGRGERRGEGDYGRSVNPTTRICPLLLLPLPHRLLFPLLGTFTSDPRLTLFVGLGKRRRVHNIEGGGANGVLCVESFDDERFLRKRIG